MVKLLEEAPGVKSASRVGFFIMLAVAIGLAILAAIQQSTITAGAAGGFLTASSALKIGSKKHEKS